MSSDTDKLMVQTACRIQNTGAQLRFALLDFRRDQATNYITVAATVMNCPCVTQIRVSLSPDFWVTGCL